MELKQVLKAQDSRQAVLENTGYQYIECGKGNSQDNYTADVKSKKLIAAGKKQKRL